MQPEHLQNVDWDATQVFGNANFFQTITAAASDALNEFARLIDVVLLFSDGAKLLLSEYEADQVLPLLWSHKKTNGGDLAFQFVNLAYTVDAVEACVTDALVMKHVSWALGRKRDAPLQPALCQLFNGETMFTKAKEVLLKSVIRELLERVRNRENVVHELVVARERAALIAVASARDLPCDGPGDVAV